MNQKYTHRTRSGLPARIVCTDRCNGSIPVIALVKEVAGGEALLLYPQSLSFTDGVEDHPLDLFEVQPWEFERPAPEVVKVGEKIRTCLFNASARKSLGGRGKCPIFNLNDFPAEFHDLITARLDEKLSAVEATYIAMRRAEAQHAGQ